MESSRYIYEPLSSTTSIRLIELKRSLHRNSPIRLSITSVPLRKAPCFDALSYTWGPSMTPFSEDQTQPSSILHGIVQIDNSQLSVGPSLEAALRMLQSVDLSAVGSNRSRYIWIDALCINQEDNGEKSIQVGLMGQIYSEATNVVVWLGVEDEFTKDALTSIKCLSKIPPERYPEVNISHWYDQANVLSQLGVGSLHYTHWLGLTAFLNRPWFKRVWIVQEVILARNAIVVCGTKMIPWKQISRTISFLTATLWYEQLSTDKMRESQVVTSAPGHYKKLLQSGSNVNIGMAAIYLEVTRAGICHSGHLAIFWWLLFVHRHCEATNPRDKIYGLLSLTWKERPPFSTHPGAITPNYDISTERLYSRVAKSILISHKSLRCLSHVEDHSCRAMKTLPTWVPDYSVVASPHPIHLRGTSRWSAGGNIPWTWDNEDFDSTFLGVSGILLDKVRGAERDVNVEWGMMTMGMTAFMMDKFRLASEISEVQTNIAKTRLSRVEILWRTCLMDTFCKHTPAPAETGQLFFERLAYMVSYALLDEENSPTEGHTPRWELLVIGIREMLESEPENSSFHFSEFESLLADTISQATANNKDLGQITFEMSILKQEMPTLNVNKIGSFLAEIFLGTAETPVCETDLNQKFRQFDMEIDSVAIRRRMFLTYDGRLGIGPLSLKPEDEIWILGGAEVPYVLRKANNGDYHLVGEAYIHGVMHGEATKLGKEVQDLKLY